MASPRYSGASAVKALASLHLMYPERAALLRPELEAEAARYHAAEARKAEKATGTNGRPSRWQVVLPTLNGSPQLQQLVQSTAPRRPYCGQNKMARIRPLETAISMPFMQLNPPSMAAWLILDVDRDCAGDECQQAGLPPPTFVIINPANRHMQAGYALAAPVCTSAAGRSAPLRYLAAIEHAYVKRVHADLGFTGPLSKNPLYEGWQLLEPANAPRYDLADLAACVDLPKRLPKRETHGLRRNCSLFDSLRAWACRAIRQYWRPGGAGAWLQACRDKADDLNTYSPALPVSESNSIARSVARWTWRHITPAGFHDVQAARGRRSGIARHQTNEARRASARLMRTAGRSLREIADELAVDHSTVSRWCRGVA